MPKSFDDLFRPTQYPDKKNAVYTIGEIKSCPQWKNVLDCLNDHYIEHRLHRTSIFSALVCEESLTPSLHSLDLETKLNPESFSLMQMFEPVQKAIKKGSARKTDPNTSIAPPMMIAEEGGMNFSNHSNSGFKVTESYMITNHDLSNDRGMLQMLEILNLEHALKDTKRHQDHGVQTRLFDLKSKSLSDLSNPSVPLPLWFQDTLLQLALQGAQNYCLVVPPERDIKTEITKTTVTFDDLVFISAFPHLFNDNTPRVQDSLDRLSADDLNSNFANSTINAMNFHSCNASNRFFNALCAMVYLKSKPELSLGPVAVLGASSEEWVERMSKMNLLDACDLKGMALFLKETSEHREQNPEKFQQVNLLSQKLEALFDKKYLSEQLKPAQKAQPSHYKI